MAAMIRRLPLALVATLLLASRTAHATHVDGIVAVVNDEVITQSQLEEMKMPLGDKGFITYGETDDPAVKKRLLERLIDKKLQLQRARELGIVVPETDVDGAIDDVRQRNQMSEAELTSSLKEQGLTMADYRQQIREQMTIARLVHREVRSRIVVNDEEAMAYYKGHPDLFSAPERRTLCRIFFRYDPLWEEARKHKTRDRIAAAIDQIKRGVPFEEVAKAFSEGPTAGQGGLLGSFKKGEMQPELDRFAFGLQEREVSELIRTKDGYSLLYVKEIASSAARPFVDVQDDIVLQLQSNRMSEQYDQWMKDLHDQAYVEVKLHQATGGPPRSP